MPAAPNLTADRICCPECGQRAPYLPTGLADWHTNTDGGVCAAVFPPYVVARDAHVERRRRRVAPHGIPR